MAYMYTIDLGSNAPPNPVLVATTVTKVSDYVTPTSSHIADAAPTPALVLNVPTPTVRQARKGVWISDKHGKYAATQVDGTAKKRRYKT